LRREENQRTQRKTLAARVRTNNKLNPHMTPGPGILKLKDIEILGLKEGKMSTRAYQEISCGST